MKVRISPRKRFPAAPCEHFPNTVRLRRPVRSPCWMSRPRRLLPSWHAGTRAQVEWAARSRWRRVPASAGARHFRGRRHLPLLGHRRRGKPSEIDARCAELPPHPPCARPSHPARPTHGSRTFPPLCTAHTSLARLLAPQPLCALVCADAQFSPLTSTRVDGDASRRRGGGGGGSRGPRGRPGEGEGGDGARRGRLHHKEYT